MIEFAGKSILVSGASSGIGRACAVKLAEAGANLVLLGRDESALSSLGISSARVYSVNLAIEPEVKALVPQLKADINALHGCVLAAGLHSFRPMMMESFDDIARPWSINAQSSLGLVALLLKARLLAKGASVVLFSSAAARTGGAGAVSYAASKGAIEGTTHSLALELAAQRIRVNAVSPGVVRTPMSEKFLSRLTSEQLAALEARHPMGIGSPEDVVGPVLFLLSDLSRWVTGTVLPVDGGYAVS